MVDVHEQQPLAVRQKAEVVEEGALIEEGAEICLEETQWQETEPIGGKQELGLQKTGNIEKQADAFAYWMEPGNCNDDASYVSMRRLLLRRKALGGNMQRKTWECNGADYVAYKQFIHCLRNQNSQHLSSPLSTPGDSGRWPTSPDVFSSGDDGDRWLCSKSILAQERFSFRTSLSRGPSFGSVSSEADHGQTFKEPGYSFVGMHCIFDQIKASVSIVKFGNRSSELLAFGAFDGGLAICTVADLPHILHQLKGHTKSVTDLDWSLSNRYLCSTSMDRSVRIWDVDRGHCVRFVYGNTEQLCIRFHPVNNNFLLVGNANRELMVINFSTGRAQCKLTLESNITCMDTDHTGHLVFAGDEQGSIHSVMVNSHTGTLSHVRKNSLGLLRKSVTVTVQYRIFSLLANGPVLLASNQDGSIRLFSITLEVHGYLALRCSLQLGHRARKIHASFCPLLSMEKGEYIVSGSEDGNVYFYDFTRPKHPCVNKLQGHGSPVVGVAWNYGENLLASSDCDGTVIVWKRANVGQ